MCLPLCTLKLAEGLSRRSALRSLTLAAGAYAASLTPKAAEFRAQGFERVVDLTHTLSPSFPSPWQNPLQLEQISKLGHHYWLGQNKWGLENVANLGQLPPKGATVVVGRPKIAGCTGGPSRVMALV